MHVDLDAVSVWVSRSAKGERESQIVGVTTGAPKKNMWYQDTAVSGTRAIPQVSMSEPASPYTDLAPLYDDLFAVWGKNYAEEAEVVHDLILRNKISAGRKLLDVGCGTAEHLRHLQRYFNVTGLDGSSRMLEIARQKLPGTLFFKADMAEFVVETKFDVIISLFSAISYVRTVHRLNQTLMTFGQHLEPGGIVIIEPWYTPEEFEAHRHDVMFGERPDFRACRMRESFVNNRVAWITDHVLISTGDKVTYQVSRHEFGLFTNAEISSAMRRAGLEISYVDRGLSGIGIHVGVKPT